MIDIKRGRYVESVARKWLDWLHDYFLTVYTGKKRPWMDTTAGRLPFVCYADKLYFQLESIIREYARGQHAIENWGLALLRLCWIHFDDIILASPAQLEIWVNGIKMRRRQPKRLIEMIKGVIVPYYETIASLHGHDLVNALDIKTCPYCNRQFIQSFEALRAERPELDHFYPKASYPMFCLSFFNLIPTCHSCNHVKLENEIGVNPYSRAFNSRFVIIDKKSGRKLSPSKIYKLTKKQIEVKLDGKSVEEALNSQVLGLEIVYNKHTDYVSELIDKSMAYDAHARQALVNSFQGAGYHPRQVYDFVWGKHLMDAEYEDRPLSKLTKDVLDLLGIRRG